MQSCRLLCRPVFKGSFRPDITHTCVFLFGRTIRYASYASPLGPRVRLFRRTIALIARPPFGISINPAMPILISTPQLPRSVHKARQSLWPDLSLVRFRVHISSCFLSLTTSSLALSRNVLWFGLPRVRARVCLPLHLRRGRQPNHPLLFNHRHCIHSRRCIIPHTRPLMSQNLRRRLFSDREQDTPERPLKKQKRNPPPDLKTRVLNRQFRMALFGNSKFNTHLAVPSFLGGKSTKRDAPVRTQSHAFEQPEDLDLELSFASTMSLNSPARDSQPLTPEDENPNHVPMDISPIPPPRFQPPALQPTLQMSNPKPFVGRPRAATSAARLFGRDMSNGHDSSSLYSASSISKSGTGSTAKRLQRAALPTEWLASSRPSPDENAFSQVSGCDPDQSQIHCTGACWLTS